MSLGLLSVSSVLLRLIVAVKRALPRRLRPSSGVSCGTGAYSQWMTPVT